MTASIWLRTPIELGALDHVEPDTLLAQPAARLFQLVTALDEHPHTLRGFHALVTRVLETAGSAPGLELLREGAVGEAARALRQAFRDQRAVLDRTELSDRAARRMLTAYLPAGLSDGRLLHYAANCTLAHTGVGMAILRLQRFEMGEGELARQPVHRLRGLCAALGIDDLETLDFCGGAVTDDAIFERPVFTWALSAFPRSFLPELLGAALVHYAARIPPVVVALGARLPARAYVAIDALATATTPQLAEAVHAAEQLLAAFPTPERATVAARLAAGAATAWALAERWTRAVWSPSRPDDAAAQVAEIFASRRAVGAGFHQRLRLGGHSLEHLLTSDAETLLPALAGSRYVVPGNAQASPIIRAMTALDGAMFRVFSDAEIATISAWIDGLDATPIAISRPAAMPALWRGLGTGSVGPCRWWGARATIAAYEALPSRTVIRRILDVEKHPDVRVFALHHITRCLTRAQALLDPATSAAVSLPPGEPLDHDFVHLRPYTPEALDDLLAAQARLQQAGHAAWTRQRSFPPRAQVRADLAAGMPAGLIDGAWLQYLAASELLHDVATCYLFRIYDDELGNGVDPQHHGNILRDLLSELGVAQPDLVASDFTAYEAYADANCIIALIWLCISLFPKRLRPEILGLNLGIESWGVGGAFRISEATLRHHGLSPLLPRLHNAIDNYGDGHTGWAKHAIHRYLAQAFRAGGDPLRQHLWTRIWTGYALWSTRHQLRLDLDASGPARSLSVMPS